MKVELLELKFQFFFRSDVITANRFPYKAADRVLTALAACLSLSSEKPVF